MKSKLCFFATDFAAFLVLTTTLNFPPLTTTQASQCDHSSVVLCMRVSMDTITVGTEERAKFEGAYDYITTLTYYV
jgi:hypothetical protein